MHRSLTTPEKTLQTLHETSYRLPTVSSKAKERAKLREYAPFSKRFSADKRYSYHNLDNSALHSSTEIADLPTIDDLNADPFNAYLLQENQIYSSVVSACFDQEPDTESSEKIIFDPEAIIKNVFKEAEQELHRINTIWIGEVLNEVLTDVINGITMDRFQHLRTAAESQSEVDSHLSSTSVIGSDETGDKRDQALIPDVEDIQLSEEKKDQVFIPVAESMHTSEDKSLTKRTTVTEPEADIEIYGSRLSDKLSREVKIDVQNVAVEKASSPVFDTPTSRMDRDMSKRIVEMKKNMKNRREDDERLSKRERFRGMCCAGRVEGGCNIF